MPWDPSAVQAAVAAVRSAEAEARGFLWDTTEFHVEDGALRVEGEVLVPSQAARYRRALAALPGAGLPPPIPIRTALDRPWTTFSWMRVEAGGLIDLHRAPSGDTPQTQVPPGSRLRWFADREGRSLVQAIDGTLGWAECQRLRPESPPSDPWRNTLRAKEGAALPGETSALARITHVARSRIGAPYRLGACGEGGWDCSGLVQDAFSRGVGVVLPKHTTDQIRHGVRVAEAALAPGDLLFVQGRARRLHHVGLVAAGDHGLHVIHACLSRAEVIEEALPLFLERYRYVGARRILLFPGASPEAGGEARGPVPAIISSLAGQRIHVVGASSAEGAAVLLHLAGEHGLTGLVGHDFAEDALAFARSFRRSNSGYERKEREAMLGRIRRLPIELRLGPHYLEGVEGAQVVFASQNWFNYAPNHPCLDAALEGGARLMLQVELAMALFAGTRVGITGSNGKSTTAAMTTWLLAQGGGTVLQGGNDRDRQASLERIEAAAGSDRLVWEVSNRHLRTRGLELDVAALTGVTRNHVQDHGTFEAYVAAKGRIFSSLGPGRHGVVSADDPVGLGLLPELRSSGAALWIAGAPPSHPAVVSTDALLWIDGGELHVTPPAGSQLLGFRLPWTLRLPGRHNVSNALIACAAALAAGAGPDDLAALAAFPGLPGRQEIVADQDGVHWMNDLGSTTAPSTEAALITEAELGRRVLLIMGGDDKDMDFRGMAAAAARCAEVLVLPGTGTDAFLRALGERAPLRRFERFDDVLIAARDAATPGSTVLLSPGCAFFQSRFLDDGPSFAARVRVLLGAS